MDSKELWNSTDNDLPVREVASCIPEDKYDMEFYFLPFWVRLIAMEGLKYEVNIFTEQRKTCGLIIC